MYSLEMIKECFQIVQDSDFLSGRSAKFTSCGIDWVLKQANWTKIVEGNYANKSATITKKQGMANFTGRDYQKSDFDEFFTEV